MPEKKTKHVKKWDSCFNKLKKEKGESSAAAICSSSIKNAGLKAEFQKRDKKDYYSNIKKEDSKKNENILSFSNFSINESDVPSGGGAYPGPNLVNSISGQMVGSGSDGKLGPKQTEIEGGQDQPTSTGEFPMKYKTQTVKKINSKESRARKSGLKKMQKINMMSFSDFKPDNDKND